MDGLKSPCSDGHHIYKKGAVICDGTNIAQYLVPIQVLRIKLSYLMDGEVSYNRRRHNYTSDAYTMENRLRQG